MKRILLTAIACILTISSFAQTDLKRSLTANEAKAILNHLTALRADFVKANIDNPSKSTTVQNELVSGVDLELNLEINLALSQVTKASESANNKNNLVLDIVAVLDSKLDKTKNYLVYLSVEVPKNDSEQKLEDIKVEFKGARDGIVTAADVRNRELNQLKALVALKKPELLNANTFAFVISIQSKSGTLHTKGIDSPEQIVNLNRYILAGEVIQTELSRDCFILEGTGVKLKTIEEVNAERAKKGLEAKFFPSNEDQIKGIKYNMLFKSCGNKPYKAIDSKGNFLSEEQLRVFILSHEMEDDKIIRAEVDQAASTSTNSSSVAPKAKYDPATIAAIAAFDKHGWGMLSKTEREKLSRIGYGPKVEQISNDSGSDDEQGYEHGDDGDAEVYEEEN